MSLIAESITLRNFLSVGAVPQTVTLNAAPLTLVLGMNLDVGGENSRNGVGKSSVLQAISYAWFGEPLTTIKKDNLINNINEQGMSVTLRFRRDGVLYVIERGRKPNRLRFLVGEEGLDATRGENRVTQAEIERILGMSHTLFSHIVALNTFTIPFLKLRAAEQREVIEELMGITQVSDLAEQLKLVMDAHKEALRDEDAAIKATVAANDRISHAMLLAEAEAETWARKQSTLVSEYTERAEKLADIDIDHELAVFDQIDRWHLQRQSVQEQAQAASAQIDTLKSHIGRLTQDLRRYVVEAESKESPEIVRLRQQAARLRTDAASTVSKQNAVLAQQAARRRVEAVGHRRSAADLVQQRDGVLAQLANPDAHACDVCGQTLSGTEHLASVITALERKAGLMLTQIAHHVAEADRCERDAETADGDQLAVQQRHDIQIADADEIDRDIAAIQSDGEADRRAAQTRVDDMRSEIAGLQSRLERHYVDLDTIKGTLTDDVPPFSIWGSRDAVRRAQQERDRLFAQLETELTRTNPFANKVEGLRSTIMAIDYNKLNTLTDDVKHEQFLYKLLTSKDSFIRKRIIDQNLNFLNRYLNRYLERLGLPHEVRFLPDLTVDINLRGRDFDFEQLSRGEMNRVILGTSWAFRDLWESLNTDINLMFADEVLDQGTDDAGVEAAIGVLTGLANERRKNIFLISHRENLQSQIERVLWVKKENQFTSLVEDGG